MDSDITEAPSINLSAGHHVILVFFDLEKWMYSILNDVNNIGIKGRIFVFIENVLSKCL